MKTCAVIVTFNRKEELCLNLAKLNIQKFQFDKIFVIDNHGSDNTKDYLINNHLMLDNLQYEYLEKNIGGAGGFSYGVQLAYKEGFDWIYLMDDDGRPFDSDTVSTIINYIIKNEIKSSDLYLINSLVTFDGNRLSFSLFSKDYINELTPKNGALFGEANPFNGTMLSNGLIKKIGYPNSDFFIKGDEVDYMLRAKKNGASIITLMNSLYYHPTPFPSSRKRFLWKKIYYYVEAPWKEYYSMRNKTYSLIKNGLYIKIYFNYIKRLLIVRKCKCNKKEVIKMIKKGFKDGKRGILGPTIRP